MTALDYIPDLDNKFLADNLLTSDDWEDHLSRLDDIPDILDFDPSFCSDDLLQQLQGDLEGQIPMLYEDGFPGFYDSQMNQCDSEDSGISVKQEPLSPAPSFSSDSDSSQVYSMMDYQVTPPGIPELKLDSPPLTPPHTTVYSHIPQQNNMAPMAVSGIATSTIPSVGNTTQIRVVNNLTSPQRKSSPTVTRSIVCPRATSVSATAGAPSSVHVLPVKQNNNGGGNLMREVTIKVENGTTKIVSDKNLNQILNNKVKIIPKPSSVSNASAATNSGKPLVLTAEEFAKLTTQGVLKLTPTTTTTSTSNEDIKPVIPKPTVVPSPASRIINPTHPSIDYESKAIKRQQRMIKNRESACLSRKRKKEYVTAVEERLKQFNSENDRLKQENETLKRKIDALLSENERLKATYPSSKKAACLLACLLFLTLNLGSLSLKSIFPTSNEQLNTGLTARNIHHGRTLMSVIEDGSTGSQTDGRRNLTNFEKTMRDIRDSVLRENNTREDVQLLKRLETLGSLSMCSTEFNRTESDRLTNELTGWVLGHKNAAMKLKMTEAEQLRSQFLNKFTKKRRPKKKHTGKLVWNKARPSSSGQNFEVQLFNHQERVYYDFMDIIQRRNDTFYVVSFRKDHLLLPALAHNKTMRPRMSLLMPAVTYNETMQPKPGSVAMMQIDCEVHNTRLIHVTESVIPTQHQSSTSRAAAANKSKSKWNEETP
ncbi:cyclic AMP-dependent transcription factor ATF-6 alpha-like [Tubulanus polymorphus]|uniref:cyclic AMP-dependent transcription factor ATF-6 alpha-like n=1 Tax=Tubulanus polymorphus TaxID=672921 RepID=UPI003DA57419